MSKIKGTILINEPECKGCAVCESACPLNIITMSQSVNAMGYHYAQLSVGDKCIGCASCAVVCPDSCITVYKQKL